MWTLDGVQVCVRRRPRRRTDLIAITRASSASPEVGRRYARGFDRDQPELVVVDDAGIMGWMPAGSAANG